MKGKKQEHQQDPATGKGKAKKKHFRRIKPWNMYFMWKDTQGGGIPDGQDKVLLSTPIELPEDYYQKALEEYSLVYRRPKYPKDEVIKGLQDHIRDMKQTIANLENKLYTYEKRNNDSQSRDVGAAGH